MNWIFMKRFLNWTLNSIDFGQNSNLELNQFGYPDSCPTPSFWKALDLSFLMVFLKKYFVNPAKRQNFRDASRQIFSLILRPCLNQIEIHNSVLKLSEHPAIFLMTLRNSLNSLHWRIQIFPTKKFKCSWSTHFEIDSDFVQNISSIVYKTSSFAPLNLNVLSP